MKYTKPYAIDIIEICNTYYLLSKERIQGNKPHFVGDREKLARVLGGVSPDMIIATTFDKKYTRCIVLVDYSTDEVVTLIERAERKLLNHETN